MKSFWIISCLFLFGCEKRSVSFFEEAQNSCFLKILDDSSNSGFYGYSATLHETASMKEMNGFLYTENSRIVLSGNGFKAIIADWNLELHESVIDTFPFFNSPGLLTLDTILYPKTDTIYAFTHEAEIDNKGCSDCMNVDAYTYYISRKRGVLGYVESINEDELNPFTGVYKKPRKHIKIFYCADFEYPEILRDTFENHGVWRITPEGTVRL